MRLLIFTRYPEAGRVKTRLIPALGAAGAKRLHRRMTEDTVLKLKGTAKVEVCYDGGDEGLMREWLGREFIYTPQEPGNLGERLHAAFLRAFCQGEDRVVVVGTDCPGLEKTHVEEAFLLLTWRDLVLGPAADGGYYLIGLRNIYREIFSGIPWGTGEVFCQTKKQAAAMELKTAVLAELADVDRPEDLALLEPFDQGSS